MDFAPKDIVQLQEGKLNGNTVQVSCSQKKAKGVAGGSDLVRLHECKMEMRNSQSVNVRIDNESDEPLDKPAPLNL